MYAIVGPTTLGPSIMLLLYVGFAPVTVPGYLSIPIDDSFRLEPGKWQYVDGEFVPYDGPLPSVITPAQS